MSHSFYHIHQESCGSLDHTRARCQPGISLGHTSTSCQAGLSLDHTRARCQPLLHFLFPQKLLVKWQKKRTNKPQSPVTTSWNTPIVMRIQHKRACQWGPTWCPHKCTTSLIRCQQPWPYKMVKLLITCPSSKITTGDKFLVESTHFKWLVVTREHCTISKAPPPPPPGDVLADAIIQLAVGQTMENDTNYTLLIWCTSTWSHRARLAAKVHPRSNQCFWHLKVNIQTSMLLCSGEKYALFFYWGVCAGVFVFFYAA